MARPTTVLLLLASPLAVHSFAPQMPVSIPTSVTKLHFGIPSFLQPEQDDKDEQDPSLVKKEVGLKGLVQLITAGAGAPFLGDYQGVDKETGNFMFSLEANNLVDEDGNSKQTAMPYFESGWVDPDEEAKAAKRRENGIKFPWQK